MPRNGFDVQHHQWRKLLEAVREGQAELADVEPFRAALESAQAKLDRVRKERDELDAASQRATRVMYGALEECRDAGISLRCYIKSVLGSRSEKLSRYGISPRRGNRASRRLPGSGGLPG